MALFKNVTFIEKDILQMKLIINALGAAELFDSVEINEIIRQANLILEKYNLKTNYLEKLLKEKNISLKGLYQ
ncbi:MAG: hypothetical protein J0H68_09820 [Sphingobacteriia bacterium]|nr:hypothetical protein [Sphingobacteriia bacterium]